MLIKNIYQNYEANIMLNSQTLQSCIFIKKQINYTKLLELIKEYYTKTVIK